LPLPPKWLACTGLKSLEVIWSVCVAALALRRVRLGAFDIFRILADIFWEKLCQVGFEGLSA